MEDLMRDCARWGDGRWLKNIFEREFELLSVFPSRIIGHGATYKFLKIPKFGVHREQKYGSVVIVSLIKPVVGHLLDFRHHIHCFSSRVNEW